MYKRCWKGICALMLTAALPTTAKSWKYAKCPSLMSRKMQHVSHAHCNSIQSSKKWKYPIICDYIAGTRSYYVKNGIFILGVLNTCDGTSVTCMHPENRANSISQTHEATGHIFTSLTQTFIKTV